MDKYKKHVYCEIAFLKILLSKIEAESFRTADEVEFELWIAIKKMLLSSNINLRLDISSDDYCKEIKEAEKHRLNAAKKGKEPEAYDNFICHVDYLQQNKNLSVKCLGERFPNLDNQELDDVELLDGIFLTVKDKEICNNLMSQYGVMAICPANLKSLARVLTDTGVAIRKGGSYSWRKILENKTSTCNSIVLVDNYAISKTDYIDENIMEILDVLLPRESRCPIHFSIFTTFKDNNNCSSRYVRIRDGIKNKRPSLDLRFSIYKCPDNPFHDRTIMTNNEWIGCGAGFDLIKGNTAKKATTINVIYPFLNKNIEWTSEAYANLIEDVTKQHTNLEGLEPNKDESNYFCYGDRGNRLIETIL